jgi:hypothetical protein
MPIQGGWNCAVKHGRSGQVSFFPLHSFPVAASRPLLKVPASCSLCPHGKDITTMAAHSSKFQWRPSSHGHLTMPGLELRKPRSWTFSKLALGFVVHESRMVWNSGLSTRNWRTGYIRITPFMPSLLLQGTGPEGQLLGEIKQSSYIRNFILSLCVLVSL